MKNILIVSGHPDLKQSVVNAMILDVVSQALPQAEIRRLDVLSPTGQFDIAAEQQALLQASVIVWQFPFSWYSVPGLLKQWMDTVFQHGFSHGSGAQLAGKKLLISFTTGAPQQAYTQDGAFHFSLDDYLPPFKTTAALCQMTLLPPVCSHGVSYAARGDRDLLAQQQQVARQHAARLIDAIRLAAA